MCITLYRQTIYYCYRRRRRRRRTLRRKRARTYIMTTTAKPAEPQCNNVYHGNAYDNILLRRIIRVDYFSRG